MTIPRLRDCELDREDGQTPTIGVAAVLVREDVTRLDDSTVRKGMEPHQEWRSEREKRRRARETATEEQARHTAYTDDDVEAER